jgi:hypothetical protein
MYQATFQECLFHSIVWVYVLFQHHWSQRLALLLQLIPRHLGVDIARFLERWYLDWQYYHYWQQQQLAKWGRCCGGGHFSRLIKRLIS